jgi:hypothetical protein
VVVHKVKEADRKRSAQAAMELGYPRAITWTEIQCGTWYEADEGIGWLLPGIEEFDYAFHGVTKPGVKLGRDLEVTLRQEGRKLGAKRISVPIMNLMPAMRRLFAIRGWKQDDWGPYLEV